MTAQPTATIARGGATVPPDGRHQHTNGCFWDVEECRWQCATCQGVRNALARWPPIGRLVEHTGSEFRP